MTFYSVVPAKNQISLAGEALLSIQTVFLVLSFTLLTSCLLKHPFSCFNMSHIMTKPVFGVSEQV